MIKKLECKRVFVLVFVFLATVMLCFSSDWPSIPTDEEIEEAVQLYVREATFEDDGITLQECQNIKDVMEQQYCLFLYEKQFQLGPEILLKNEVTETFTIQMHHSKSPETLAVLLLSTQVRQILNEDGKQYSRTYYSTTILEFRTDATSKLPAHWRFSSGSGAYPSEVVRTDGTSKEQREAVIASLFRDYDPNNGYYGWIRGFSTVVNQSPQVTLFIFPEQPTILDKVLFEAQAVDADHDTLRFKWTLDDKPLPDSAAIVEIAALPQGNHQMVVTVEDGRGGTDEAVGTFQVILPQTETEDSLQILAFCLTNSMVENSPANSLTEFSLTDDTIYCYLEFSEIQSDHELVWQWYDSQGTLYKTDSVTLRAPSAAPWAYALIDIKDSITEEETGMWMVEVLVDGVPIQQQEFWILPSSANAEITFDNVFFQFPDDWYRYESLEEGICEVYYFDDDENYLAFMVYFTNDDLFNSEEVNSQLLSESIRSLSFTDISIKETLMYDEQEGVWYLYCISEIQGFFTSEGQRIFLISYAPQEVYDDYRPVFDQILDSVHVILY